MVSLTSLDDSEKKLIGKLLRMRHACNKYGFPQMQKYLKDIYKIDLKNSTQLSRWEKGESLSDVLFVGKWREFIAEEKDLLSNEARGGGSLNFPYKFNYASAMKLSESAMGSDKCIFFNTYINLDAWHNALVQMHLCVQKSIEQKNNFVAVCGCHALKMSPINKRKGAIEECSKNPPSYRHYRILFLPYLNKEFKNLMEEKRDGLAENLKFSTLMHRMLSIQLAVLTVSDLANIIREPTNSKFFKDKGNLEKLGLSPRLADLFGKENEFLEQLQKDVKGMAEIPKNDQPNKGIDFVHFDKKANTQGNLIWSANYEDEEGLSYYPITDTNYALVKKLFSEIVFNAISTKQQRASQLDILNFDPLHYLFYNANQDLTFTGILPKFDSLIRTGLAYESFS